MQYLGDYRIDDYITFGAQLHRFSSGAVYDPTGNATYTFYENNSTSGAPSGSNLAKLNSKTGLYTARVQLTTASGFESGKEYLIHIEATVDGVAAAELLMFRIIANPKVEVDTIGTTAVNTIADGVLNRDMSTGTDSGSPTVRTVRQALRFLRNKWSLSGGTLTVCKEDDSTTSWTAAVTTTEGADPITASDPASS